MNTNNYDTIVDIKRNLDKVKKNHQTINEMIFNQKKKRRLHEDAAFNGEGFEEDESFVQEPTQEPIRQEQSVNIDSSEKRTDTISEEALPKIKEIQRIVLMELPKWTNTDAVSRKTYNFFDSIKNTIDKELANFVK